MRLWAKIVTGSVILILLVLVGLTLLVRYYLRPDRIRPLVIARAEEALGRKVILRRVEVGPFKGVYLRGLTVKEADGRTDFVRLKALRVRFSLWPLLHRKLVFTRAEVIEPYVHLVRYRDGTFNWESLRLLRKKSSGPRGSATGARTSGTTLPLALVVPRFEVRRGLLVFEDRTGALPRLKIPFGLRASVSPRVLEAALRFDLLKEPYRLDLSVRNYLSAPELTLNLSGEKLDLNPFLRTSSGAAPSSPQTRAGSRAPSPGKRAKPALPVLPFRKLRAQVTLGEILYRRLAVTDLRATAVLEGHRLISDLRCRVADGEVSDHLEAELASPPTWRLRETGKGIRLAPLLSGLYPDLPGRLEGVASYDGNFTAQGGSLPAVLDTLAGKGVFEVKSLQLSEIPATRELARVLNLPELRTLIFEQLRGDFRVQKRRVVLQAALQGPALKARVKSGSVTFDGVLDLPVDLTFSRSLSDKLVRRLPLAAHLRDAEGRVQLTVYLRGPYRRPRVSLGSRSLEERIRERLRKLLPLPF